MFIQMPAEVEDFYFGILSNGFNRIRFWFQLMSYDEAKSKTNIFFNSRYLSIGSFRYHENVPANT